MKNKRRLIELPIYHSRLAQAMTFGAGPWDGRAYPREEYSVQANVHYTNKEPPYCYRTRSSSLPVLYYFCIFQANLDSFRIRLYYVAIDHLARDLEIVREFQERGDYKIVRL